jgi:transposase
MDIIYTSCCGLDVHKRTIQACVRRVDKGGKIHHQVRSFSTMTGDILVLANWLAAEEVTHVAMESTGVYWKPIYNILEGRFTILLVNARHVKNVPGRKTDVKDCQWLAQLLQCGLLKGSFIPDRPQRELRDLTRHRSQLVAERTAVANRIHKVLEDTNIKLGSVATDILGTSGREMIRALIAGEKDPEKLAELARQRLREKIPELRLALQGHVTDHHRFVLGELMDHIEYLEGQIDRFSARIEEISRPFEKAIEAVTQMPGFEKRSAENVIAEIGINMDQFPSAGHLASWAGMCPGNNESAGKSKSSKTTKGSRWLRCALTQAAWAATHKKGSYFQAKYRRLVGRRGKKRALVAIGHSMLVAIYHILKFQVQYQDLGSDFFDRLNSEKLVKHHVNKLKSLGYNVTLTEPQQQEAA